jgi:hypothetical protein
LTDESRFKEKDSSADPACASKFAVQSDVEGWLLGAGAVISQVETFLSNPLTSAARPLRSTIS